MSNMADTSMLAHRSLDVTSGQKKILDFFYTQAPGSQFTRQQLVPLLNMPINCITGRVNELLKLGKLDSLPAIEGRHPLRLKYTKGVANESGQVSQSNAERGDSAANGSHYTALPGDIPIRERQSNPATIPDARNGKPNDGQGGLDTIAPIYITPHIDKPYTLSLETAKRIFPSDPRNAFYDLAKATMEKA